MIASIVGGRFRASVTLSDGEVYFIDPAILHPSSRGYRNHNNINIAANKTNNGSNRQTHVVYPASATVPVKGGCGVENGHGHGGDRNSGQAAGEDYGESHTQKQKHPSLSEKTFKATTDRQFYGKQQYDFEGHAKASQEAMRFRRTGAGGDPDKFTCVIEAIADHRYFEFIGLNDRTTTIQAMLSVIAKANAIFSVSADCPDRSWYCCWSMNSC